MLTVLVVAMGSGDASRSAVRHELSLVRSAVLYADKVTVMSGGAELLLGYSDLLATAGADEIRRALQNDPELLRQVESLQDPNATLTEIAEAVRGSAGIWPEEYRDFDLGRRSGIVTLEPITGGPYSEGPGVDGLSDGQRFTDRLLERLRDPAIHPLLDRQAADIARAAQQSAADVLPPSVHKRARTAEVGGGMIARLPAFPQSPLDELLDVKAELAPALDRYRSVVAELQKLVDAQLGAEEMDAELDELWVAKVRPALRDLEDVFVDHAFVRELARSLTTSAKALVTQGAGLYVALSTLGDLASHIAAAASLAGVGA